MRALVRNEGKIARITFMNAMLGFIERRRPWDVAQDCICTKHLLDGASGIVCWGQILEHFCHRIYRFAEFFGLRASIRIPLRSCLPWPAVFLSGGAPGEQ
jgi:hypothetical protein